MYLFLMQSLSDEYPSYLALSTQMTKRSTTPSSCRPVWRKWRAPSTTETPTLHVGGRPRGRRAGPSIQARGVCTYDFSSCFLPKFKVMHFQNDDIKLYTVVLLFLFFLNILTNLCCRWSWSRRSTVNNCRVHKFQIPDRRAQ